MIQFIANIKINEKNDNIIENSVNYRYLKNLKVLY